MEEFRLASGLRVKRSNYNYNKTIEMEDSCKNTGFMSHIASLREQAWVSLGWVFLSSISTIHLF